MKIEKLNDHQIRCTLTKEDLAQRHINLSELAYGTEKTRALFHDMMAQASREFGFEADDIPLMIEAIPLSPEKIVLIITKVESPDELDTRFSSFTHPEDFLEESVSDKNPFLQMPDPESDLSDLLNEIKKDNPDTCEPVPDDAPVSQKQNQTRHFSCRNLNEVMDAAQMVSSAYEGENSLYKDPGTGVYHLFIHQGAHTALDFNRYVHMISNYLKKEKCAEGSEAFCREHFRVILGKQALQMLGGI